MASHFAPFVSLALSCTTIYSLAWRRPAGLTHTTEQDRRWISMQSLLPSSAMCNWSVSNRETTKTAHNRKVLEGKWAVCVFFGKFVEIPKQKVFFWHDELKWRCHKLGIYIFFKEVHNLFQVPTLPIFVLLVYAFLKTFICSFPDFTYPHLILWLQYICWLSENCKLNANQKTHSWKIVGSK